MKLSQLFFVPPLLALCLPSCGALPHATGADAVTQLVQDATALADAVTQLAPDTAALPDAVTQLAPDADAVTPPAPQRVYGLTLDDVQDLPTIVDALKSLPHKPWVRIVFDYPLPPSAYVDAVTAIAPWAVIVGQPADSTYMAQMDVAQYRARFADYVAQFTQIAIWETCNECNGDWLGPNASAQADAAMDVVKAAGKKAMFTPYWNTVTCADNNGPYLPWIAAHISDKVKAQSDYVMPSVYGSDCDGPEPSYDDLNAMLDTLAAMFPNAQVGIGEYGKQGDADILKYYMSYASPNPRFIFAGLYWYGRQDLTPKTKPLWQLFSQLMN